MVIIFNASLRDMFSIKQHEYNPYLREESVSLNWCWHSYRRSLNKILMTPHHLGTNPQTLTLCQDILRLRCKPQNKSNLLLTAVKIIVTLCIIYSIKSELGAKITIYCQIYPKSLIWVFRGPIKSKILILGKNLFKHCFSA